MANILLVDDEVGIVAVLERMLQSHGHAVSSTANANQALTTLSNYKVDLLITDIVMPELDGIALISKVKEKHPKLKIIAISGGSSKHGPKTYLEQARSIGADSCLTKPFILSELVEQVDQLLSES